MKGIQTAILFICFALGAFAQEFTPEYFDYGFHVTVKKKSAVHSVLLPAHVYQNIRKPGLADVQVFNSMEETVPFTVVTVEPYTYEHIDNKPLLFFPLYREVEDNGTVKTVMDELIIDLRHDLLLPQKLMLNFSAGSNFNAVVSVATSQGDLGVWTEQTSGTLARLTNTAGSLILQNEIVLPEIPVDTQYIKLSAAPDDSSLRLSAEILSSIIRINAIYPDKPVYHMDYNVLEVVGQRTADHKNAVEFDLQGFYPIDGVVFKIQPSYLFPSYAVKYKYRPEGGWTAPANSSMTRNLDHQQVTNVVLNGYGRYWQLSTQDALPEEIAARFEWRPQELVFLDKGEGPYTIAYGSAYYDRSSRSGAAQIEALMGKQRDISVSVSEPFKLGDGDQNPEPQLIGKKKSMIPTYILVVVIVLVVIFMTVSAIRLMKSMDHKQDE